MPLYIPNGFREHYALTVFMKNIVSKILRKRSLKVIQIKSPCNSPFVPFKKDLLLLLRRSKNSDTLASLS
jgi:hypothetical protein